MSNLDHLLQNLLNGGAQILHQMEAVGDLNSIADLAKIPDLLRARGYGAADIDAIASGNYIRFVRSAWSE